MIPALTCLLFPFAWDCPELVRDVPRIADVAARKAYYSGKPVSVTGRVRGLDQWTSPVYGEEELFWICEGPCIRVYARAHSSIHNGVLATVSGQYYAAIHQYRHTYYNEIEAAQVLLRE